MPNVLQLTDTFQALISSNTKSKTKLSLIHVANVTGTIATVSFCLTPQGDTPQLSNAIAWDIPISANDFVEFGDGLEIPFQCTLYAKASVSNTVNVHIST